MMHHHKQVVVHTLTTCSVMTDMKYWQDVFHICMHLNKLRDGLAEIVYSPSSSYGVWTYDEWQVRMDKVKAAQALMESLADE